MLLHPQFTESPFRSVTHSDNSTLFYKWKFYCYFTIGIYSRKSPHFLSGSQLIFWLRGGIKRTGSMSAKERKAAMEALAVTPKDQSVVLVATGILPVFSNDNLASGEPARLAEVGMITIKPWKTHFWFCSTCIFDAF
jgi:hypothetical protein